MKKYEGKRGGGEIVSNNEDIPINYLVIVESPSKCGKIEEYLNENIETRGAKVVATLGHLYKIKGLKDIDMKNGKFDIKYSILEEKEKHIVELRKQIKKGGYNKIILATDNDREGEFIAWSICDLFKLPIDTTQRIIFHEITKPAIINAILNPTIINMNIVNAQQCRTVLDLLIGYKISPILWKYMLKPVEVKNETLSAGRCQTPALKLIYDAHLLWKNECPQYEYITTGEFMNPPLLFTLTPPLANDIKEGGIEEFINREIARNNIHYLTIDEIHESVHKAPKPLNTSSLLQQASLLLKLGPKQTMQLAQQLYQEGHITYMRTESTEISNLFKSKIQNFIINKYGEPYVKSIVLPINNDKMPHEAIRCTNLETMGYIGNNDAKGRLYNLIWKHSIYSSIADSRCNVTKFKINTHKTMEYTWKTEISVPTFDGWTILNNKETHNKILPEHYYKYKDKTVILDEITITNALKNKQNNHYTESGLIKKLEDIGIGRPSTFHTITETIKDRGYVKIGNIIGTTYESITYNYKIGKIKVTKQIKLAGEEKNKLIITELGIKTVEFLINNFQPLFNYNYTSKMEEVLDKIANYEPTYIDDKYNDLPSDLPINKSGKINQRTICNDCLCEIKKCISNINTTSLTFEDNGENYELYYSQNGPLIRNTATKEIYNIKCNKKIEEIINSSSKEIVLSEIVYIPLLGYHNGIPLYAKMGKFGPYIQYGEKNISVKSIDNIKLEDAVILLEETEKKLNDVVIKKNNSKNNGKNKYKKKS